MKRHLPTIVVLAFVFCVSDTLGGRDRPAPSTSPVTIEGLIKASRVVQLSSPADGLLESVKVDRGDHVARDQVVAKLESRVEQATLALATARAEMEADQQSRQARLEYQTHKLSRDEDLHSRGILSDNELAVSRTEKLVAEQALLESQEMRNIARLEQKRAEVALEIRTLRSPIDGVVIERYLSKGELVTRQHQSKILELAQVDPLTVEVIVPASLFGHIKPGTTAVVTPKGFPESQSTVTVQSVDRVIDAASNTFRVGLELPNPENQLPAGIKCGVKFSATGE